MIFSTLIMMPPRSVPSLFIRTGPAAALALCSSKPAKTRQNPRASVGFEMGATLTGAKLFRTRGYLPVRNLVVPLINGESLPIIHMEKQA